jgi:hypothetical protein
MKQTHHNNPIQHSAISAMHEAIATKAYELWMREGSPENQSDAIWLAAEQELLTGRRSIRPVPAPLPVSF